MIEKKVYESPQLVNLGTLADKTQTGFGNAADGASEPPQSVPDPNQPGFES